MTAPQQHLAAACRRISAAFRAAAGAHAGVRVRIWRKDLAREGAGQ